MRALSRWRPDSRPVLALLALVVGGLGSFVTAVGLLGGTPEAAAGSEAVWSRALPRTRSMGGPEAPAAVVMLDRVAVAARRDGVAAFDPSTGEVLWTRDLPVEIFAFGREGALVPVGDDRVAVALGSRREDAPVVAVLDVTDGTTVWELTGLGTSSLEAAAGTVVVSGWAGSAPSITAYDAADGQPRWRHDLPSGEAWSSDIAVAGDAVFVTFDAGRSDPATGEEEPGERFVAAFDIRSGEQRWRVDTDLRPFALDGAEGRDPLVVLGRDGERNTLLALDPATGQERWRWAPDSGTALRPVVEGGWIGTLVDVSPGDIRSFDEPPFVLVVLDVEGREVLRDDPRFDMRFRFAGDRLVIAAADGSAGAARSPRSESHALLSMVDLPTGEVAWERSYPTMTPWDPLGIAPVGDVVIVSQTDGAVHQVGLDDGATAWTTAPFSGVRDQADRGPVMTTDAVYLLADDGAVRSIDTADGDERWSRLHSVVGASPPAVDERRVYAATGLGVVRAYDRGTGEVVWETERRHDALEQGAPRPAVAADTVAVADPDGTLLALDSATGEQRWAAPASGVLGVAGYGSRIVVAYSDGRLESLDARSGDQAWATQTGATLRWGPIPAGNVIVAVTSQGRAIALDPTDGQQIWDFGTGEPVLPQPARDATSLYVLTDRVTALDLSDGSIRWEALPDESASFAGRPAAAQGQVFVTATDLTVRVLSAATGEQVDAVDVATPINAISATPDALLLVETSDGELRAYR